MRSKVLLRLFLTAAWAALLMSCAFEATAWAQERVAEKRAARGAASSSGVRASAAFNLKDFGAVGDGVEDDGPALQRALDALAEAGGGELFVPEGRYAVATSVGKDFRGLASSVTIYGVESSVQVPLPTVGGEELTRGLNLVSEFIPRTGDGQVAISISGLQSFLLKDVSFAGTPDVSTDALVTLYLEGIADAVVRHCEFYGLSSLALGGAIVTAERSRLSVEQTKFLGCAANSGVYSSVIQNVEWEGLSVSNTVFTDYGQRELFGKLGDAAPYSWINLGNAAATGPDSPRREVSLREVFFDEGALSGISSLPYDSGVTTAPFDLLYVTGLFMNVSNLNTSGHYLQGVQGILVEKSLYGWSHNADTAINLLGAGNAILDEVVCIADADTIRADSETTRLSVVNSTYGVLDSQAQTTEVVNVAPEDDRVQHVRRRFVEVLGRAPDAAAHFYWSDRLLRCGEDSQCLADGRAALDIYLGNTPQTDFAVTGRVAGEDGAGLPGVTVTLGGSQQVSAVTDADGRYRFSRLPTSGVYTVTPTRRRSTLNPQSLTIATPAGDRVADFRAVFKRHDLMGRVTGDAGSALAGVTVLLSGSQTGKATTDADGNYSFQNLPAGGDYIVMPALRNYTFTPAARTFDDLGGDQTVVFSGGLSFYTIGGRVTEKGAGLGGVALTLTGTQAGQATTDAAGLYSFRVIAEGNYAVTPTNESYLYNRTSASFANLSGDQLADFAATPRPSVEFGAASSAVSEDAGAFEVVVTRGGDTSGKLTVNYSATDGTARQGADLSTVIGQTTFAPGETTRTITVYITDDAYVEGTETATLSLRDPTGGAAMLGNRSTATLTITDNDQSASSFNPSDDARFFVRQHYRDFLNREPDAAGLDFWAKQIVECGMDAACLGVKRQNVSAAFFLSIEFRDTGFLVYRLYKSAYGRMPRRVEEFLFDSHLIGEGVAVGLPGWAEKLDANKNAFVSEFVARPSFVAQYPLALTPVQFVAQLNANTGASLKAEEAAALAASAFGAAADSSDASARRSVLLKVAENAEFARRELNKAFVLMQYFGYLQRHPDDAPDTDFRGFDFWLKKLDDNGGDYSKAQMVSAFIDSIEYRKRFGQ